MKPITEQFEFNFSYNMPIADEINVLPPNVFELSMIIKFDRFLRNNKGFSHKTANEIALLVWSRTISDSFINSAVFPRTNFLCPNKSGYNSYCDLGWAATITFNLVTRSKSKKKDSNKG